MKELDDFAIELRNSFDESKLRDFCRSRVLHGTPHVFKDREHDHYEFCKRVSDKFGVHYRDVLLVGSAKLGFSPRKKKLFDLDSDIDVAIVSETLFNKFMNAIYDYQMEIRHNKRAVSEREMAVYHEFLEYVALGWMRPDKLPHTAPIGGMKDDWFEFFRAISNGKCEVGNYNVSAGVFKSHDHLEKYHLNDLRNLRISNETRV